ncbi:transcriptional regulator, partial [Corynebacterium sanguinis]|nr:transcriptional regulator [Corynebacterium sanguinis]
MSDLEHTIAIADEWAPTFRLLGDATRLKLLCAIHFSGQHALTVGELA